MTQLGPAKKKSWFNTIKVPSTVNNVIQRTVNTWERSAKKGLFSALFCCLKLRQNKLAKIKHGVGKEDPEFKRNQSPGVYF